MAIIRRKSPSRPPGILPENSEYKNAQAVHDAAKENGIQTRPFNIEKFIKMHNIKVVREEMADNDISGYIECRAGGRWIIGINKYHNPRRQRFTLAHEFAHFCLHKELILDHMIVDAILFRDKNCKEDEQMANRFASEILIPNEIFKKFVKEKTRDIAELAELFGVSPAAIRYKAYKLGFIREY